jgi:hypothetical protein
MLIKDNILIIEVPNNSTEYEIDDFLGNTLQYKIGDDWIYNTYIELPTNRLEIIGILNDEEKYIKYNIDRNKKYILIKKY